MELIKDRLAHILRAKNLTASQFAEMMGIQPSNVSHLLNGRNKPSLDFLIKLKEVYPEYSFDWIIMGKKPITVNEPMPFTADNQPFKYDEFENDRVVEFDDIDEIHEDTYINDENTKINKDVNKAENTSELIGNQKVEKLIIIYSDKTFDVVLPR